VTPHPAIRSSAVSRLGGSLRRRPRPPGPDAPRLKGPVGAVARRAAQPVLGRLRYEASVSLRPELEAASEEIGRLQEELARTGDELRAEIELLRAELDARRPPRGAADA